MSLVVDGQVLATDEVDRGIGVTFRNLADHLPFFLPETEVVLTVDDLGRLERLGHRALDQFRVEVDPRFAPAGADGPDWRAIQTRQEEALAEVCDRVAATIWWSPDPLMGNVCLPEAPPGVARVATVYDLLPLTMAEAFFDRWPEHQQAAYRAKLARLAGFDLLHCISEATRATLLEQTSVTAQQTFTATLGVTARFRPSPFPQPGAGRDYLLYVGGFDPRKNLDGCLAGFAHWRRLAGLASDLQLVVVGRYDAASAAWFATRCRELGLSQREVQAVGLVDDDELLRLYRGARAFLYPSLGEGLGLPVVEALACGLPTTCAAVPGLDEAAVADAQRFDPHHPEAIAAAIERVLKLPRDVVARQRRHQATAGFSWSSCAKSLAGQLRSLGQVAAEARTTRRRLAWVSPMPPTASGIADYSRSLIEEAQARDGVALEVFWEGEEPRGLGLPCHPVSALPARAEDFDDILYHMGNAVACHREIYATAQQVPGVVVVHDVNIHPFLENAFLESFDWRLYEAAFTDPVRRGYVLRRLAVTGVPDHFADPGVGLLLAASRRLVVNNRWSLRHLLELFPAYRDRLGAAVLPAPRPWSACDRTQARARFGLPDDGVVAVCAGYQHHHKVHEVQLEALRLLRGRGFPLHLLWAGAMDAAYHGGLRGRAGRCWPHVTLTGHLDPDAYRAAFAAADVALCLRRPTYGESSASLLDAVVAGLPVLVLATKQYVEVPRGRCRFLAAEAGPTELAAGIEAVVREPVTDPLLDHLLASRTPALVLDLLFDQLDRARGRAPFPVDKD